MWFYLTSVFLCCGCLTLTVSVSKCHCKILTGILRQTRVGGLPISANLKLQQGWFSFAQCSSCINSGNVEKKEWYGPRLQSKLITNYVISIWMITLCGYWNIRYSVHWYTEIFQIAAIICIPCSITSFNQCLLHSKLES